MRNICRRISTPAQMACPSPELKELNKKGYRKMNKPTDQTIKEPLFAAFSETAPSNTALADSAYSEGSPAGDTPARPVSGANESAGKKETGKAEDENSDSEQDSTTSGKGGKKKKKKEKKKKFREGRRIRSMSAMSVFIPFIMKKRNDACNFFTDEFDIERAEEYIYEKRRQGLKSFGLMHLIVAAYVRIIADKPGINRFIRGQRVMSRNNIEIMLTIKRKMALNSEDTVVKFFPERDYTAEQVYNEMVATIKEATSNTDTDFDKTAAAFTKIPRFVLRSVMNLLHFFDYYGLLPRFLTKVSPFHGSMFITSMGSLGIKPIYHHLYNFGNVPVFISFGKTRREIESTEDGGIVIKKYLDMSFVCDERICDGYYYASVLKSLKYYIANPELLDVPPAVINEDIP